MYNKQCDAEILLPPPTLHWRECFRNVLFRMQAIPACDPKWWVLYTLA